MSTARAATAIVFAGPPQNLSAALASQPPAERSLPVTIRIAGEPVVFRAHVRPLGPGHCEIRLRLPRETPPGTYQGMMVFDGKSHATLVEVEPVVRIRVHPRQLSHSAEAGSTVEFKLNLGNTGNVTVDIPKLDSFDLDDASGQNRALGRALRATLPAGERRVDRFFEEIREAHAGEARVAVRSGAGHLAPGESRELNCLLEIPPSAQPGRAYRGAWPLGNTSHQVLIEITKSSAGNGRKRA
jgi:hypothetical protein